MLDIVQFVRPVFLGYRRKMGVACFTALMSIGVGFTATNGAESSARAPLPKDDSATRRTVEAPAPANMDRSEAIVVTATTPTRSSRPVVQIPGSVSVVSREDQRVDGVSEAQITNLRFARTLPDALATVPGVRIQKTANGQGSPYIRGFTSFRTLATIDGIRLNNSVFRPGPNQYWSTVDTYSISRLEVTKGGASVLYGSDAIGGHVNAITKNRKDFNFNLEPGWDGSVEYRFASGERSQTVRTEISGQADEHLAIQFGFTGKDYGDIRLADNGILTNSGYHEWDADLKIQYWVNEHIEFVFASQKADLNDIWRVHNTVFGQSFQGTTIGTRQKRKFDQDRDLTYFRMKGKNLGHFVDDFSITVSFQQQDETEWRVERFQRSNGALDGTKRKQGFEVDTWGLQAQLESDSPIGRWTYGAEYYRDSVDSFRTDYTRDGVFRRKRIQGPVAADATYDLLGIYVQDDISIVEDHLNLILGSRYTYAAADVDRYQNPDTGLADTLDKNWDNVVSSARLLWNIDGENRWNVYASLSQGFRAPNLSDLTRRDAARSGEAETGSTNLDPEDYIQSEIGIKSQFRNWSWSAAYWHTKVDGMILRSPTGAVDASGDTIVTKSNVGDGYMQGVEGSASWRFHPRWTVFATASWEDSEIDEFPTADPNNKQGHVKDRQSPPQALLGLRWDHAARDMYVESTMRMAGRAENDNSAMERDTQRIPPDGTPGYAVYNLRWGWQVNKHLDLNAALENFANTAYRVHGSGQNEVGFNGIFGLRLKF